MSIKQTLKLCTRNWNPLENFNSHCFSELLKYDVNTFNIGLQFLVTYIHTVHAYILFFVKQVRSSQHEADLDLLKLNLG